MYVVHPDDPGLRYEMVLMQTGSRRKAEKSVMDMQKQAAQAGRQMVLSAELTKRISRRS